MSIRLPSAKTLWIFAFALTAVATASIYAPGLRGEFIFDDKPHIVKNPLVAIGSLAPSDLARAWHSSAFEFPFNRPLAMLSFGVNHALSGMSPFAFKAVNLAIHLLVGVAIYFLAERLASLYLRLHGRVQDSGAAWPWAWLTASLWLLHPLNLSPVLYVVQRMTSLSALFVVLGLLAYAIGRRRMVERRAAGLLWIWLSPLPAAVGFFAKENALLLPLLLLVTEWTLFQWRGLDTGGRRQLALYFVVAAALPLVFAALYLYAHPGFITGGYSARPFTLGERLLTEARVLWFYVRLLLAPDISALGFYHDDIGISTGILQPWTTLVAVAGLAGVLVAALFLRRRVPLITFAVLFFLAGHLVESTVIPLELVFEHRNYLPAFGPLFALAFVATAAPWAARHRRLALPLTGLILVLLGAVTALRAHDWSGLGRLVAAEIEHHPDSPRAHFQYAQIVMTGLEDPERRSEAYGLAQHHFRRTLELDPDKLDGLFGLIVLELQVGRLPDPALVDDLTTRLRRIRFSPLNVGIGQFSFLVEWNLAAEPKLPRDQTLAILEAALQNPTNTGMARGAVYNALRAYHHRVLGELEPGLRYAELAVQTDPSNWTYRNRLVKLLAEAGRADDARQALAAATASDTRGLHAADAAELRRLLESADRGNAPRTAPDRR